MKTLEKPLKSDSLFFTNTFKKNLTGIVWHFVFLAELDETIDTTLMFVD